jgi:hypothetical protein
MMTVASLRAIEYPLLFLEPSPLVTNPPTPTISACGRFLPGQCLKKGKNGRLITIKLESSIRSFSGIKRYFPLRKLLKRRNDIRGVGPRQNCLFSWKRKRETRQEIRTLHLFSWFGIYGNDYHFPLSTPRGGLLNIQK